MNNIDVLNYDKNNNIDSHELDIKTKFYYTREKLLIHLDQK